jgi:hypothetical protein
MSRYPDPSTPTGMDPRLKFILAVLAVVVVLVLLQLTQLAPLPHSVDDFLGGVVAGLALSAIIAWSMSRA